MFDNKKIAIVAKCSNDDSARLLAGEIEKLIVPNDYEVEVLLYTAKNKGLASVYNTAQSESNAAVKLFLQEEIKLVSNKVLVDVVAAFAADEKIAMVGAVGTKQLPTNADIFTTKEMITPTNITETTLVQVLAAGIVAVRGNLKWREDIIAGDALVVEAQCVEYIKRGYKVAVAKQIEPWLLEIKIDRKECTNRFGFLNKMLNAVKKQSLPATINENDKARFLAEYSTHLYPLVSIVIPTYNRPEYFSKALESALNQTYRNIEIFITDNSHNTKTKELMKKYLAQDSRIIYEHHPDFDANGNWERAWEYNNPQAEFINMLMDDDLFKPNKLEVMVQVYMDNPDVALVTSNRECINSEGKTVAAPKIIKKFSKDTRINGVEAGNYILKNQHNFLGEPTTVLVKKSNLIDNYYGWDKLPITYRFTDFPTWLGLMTKGNAMFLAEKLSSFRLHDGQEQRQDYIKLRGEICWAMELYHAGEKLEFFESQESYQKVVREFIINGLKKLADFISRDALIVDVLKFDSELGRLMTRLYTEENNEQV